jgi:DNA mismatch repair protein MutS
VLYLRETQRGEIGHVRDISLRIAADALLIDPVTVRHLNVVDGAEGGRSGSLLDVLDRTSTPMGARMLRTWLLRPLVNLARIQDRLDAVEDFAFRTTERGKLLALLKQMHDLERLVARISLGTAGPRELLALGQSLALVPRARGLAGALQAPLVRPRTSRSASDIRERIDTTIDDPVRARPGRDS